MARGKKVSLKNYLVGEPVWLAFVVGSLSLSRACARRRRLQMRPSARVLALSRADGAASQTSLETERMNRAEMCVPCRGYSGRSERVARAGGRACWCDGQLSRLPADALVRPRVACSLPAASVLSLGGVRGWEVSFHM